MLIRAGAIAFAFLSVIPSFRHSVVLAAQVGHDPANSPYVDMRRSHSPSFMTGWIGGDRGREGVGHTNGQTFTIGYEIPLGGSASFFTSYTYARTERYVINPFLNVLQRRSGPYPDDMSLIDVGARFNLTGNKTWNGLAVYTTGAIGMAISMGSPPDPGNYEFKRKMTFTGGFGLRWFLANRLSVVGDGRVTLWRLKYPPDYYRAASPDGIPVLFPNDPETDWTFHPMVSVGLGWNF
jgi:hypothetical protein